MQLSSRCFQSAMTTKQLHLFFKVGTILAITPTSPYTHKSETLKRKIYAIFIFTLLLTGAIFSTVDRNYKYFFIKNAFLYNNDAVFVCLNFYVTIAYSFWKRKQWSEFVEKLEISYKLTQIYDSRGYPYTIFVTSHIIFLVLGIYNACVWYGIEGTVMFKKFGMRRIENYILFYYSLLLIVILGMLLTSYKKLNTIMKSYVNQKLQFYKTTLRKISYTVFFLKETVDAFNNLFGWPLLFIIYQTLLQLLIYLYFMITNEETFEVIFVQVSLIVIILVSLNYQLSCSNYYFSV